MDLWVSISERKKYLSKLMKEKERHLKNKPAGLLKGNRHGSGWQYYHRKSIDDKNGIYIKKGNLNLAMALGQKEYDEKILEAARKELYHLEILDRMHRKGKIVEDIFQHIPQSHQAIVKPIRQSDEDYINAWLSVAFDSKGFNIGAPEYYSDKGERMRSKSEVLIANMLSRYNVPYLYEKSLYLEGLGTIYPDFSILDVKNRRELYWEHLGLLDDHDYLEKALSKISYFEKNHLYLGEYLIISFETASQPLNMKNVEQRIRKILDE